MGQRTKGKMWCNRCGPVLGVKNTHPFRNTAALAGPLSFLLFSKIEAYYCPQCGNKVHPAWLTTRPSSAIREGGSPTPAVMVTPDGKWVTTDGGEHFARAPAPPAPPPLQPPPPPPPAPAR